MDISLKTIVTGEISGTITAKQLPDIPCSKVKIKAVRSNSGNVYIGGANVTKVAGGANNETAGYELDAGEETDWLPIDNLNKLYRICDNAGDELVYIAFR
jgi:hypothetical protein